MKRRILGIAFLMIIAFPYSVFAETVSSSEPYDYKNGLLDDSNVISENTLPKNVYDNDIDTNSNKALVVNKYIDFSYPVDINGMYLKHSGYIEGGVLIYLNNGEKFTELIKNSTSGYIDLKYENVIRISFDIEYTGYIHEIDFFGSYDKNGSIPGESGDTTSPGEIKNIAKSVTSSSATFDYDLPQDIDFDHVNIYTNEKKYQTTSNTFKLENLNGDTEYKVVFKTVDTLGNESDGITVNVHTDPDPEIKEIENLIVSVESNRVDLSWDLPDTEAFFHVNIYRKKEEKEPSMFNLFSVKSDDYDPIFETNGTYFNDLTVNAATSYEYKLTTEYEEMESKGVTVKATTLPPLIKDGDFEKQENGDYQLSWSEPTSGKVSVIVGGKVYETVDAKDGSFIVPADDMAYTALGDPDIGLQPIAPNGTPGDIETETGTLDDIKLPFNVKDLIMSGNGLLWLVGSFVLLALSFLLVPKIINLIRNSTKGSKNGNDVHQHQQIANDRKQREQRKTRNPNLTKRQKKEVRGNG